MRTLVLSTPEDGSADDSTVVMPLRRRKPEEEGS